MHQNEGLTHAEQVFQRLVEAGKMAAFTVGTPAPHHTTAVSLRAAVWLLQSLEGKLENHSPEAVASGEAVQVAYQYGTHKAVLGTYCVYEIDGFLFGLLAYTRRKWRYAERQVRRAQLAKKGGPVA
jgi:hypothetical protein